MKDDTEEVGSISVLTMVIWIGCLAASAFHWHANAPPPEPIHYETLDVQIMNDAAPRAQLPSAVYAAPQAFDPPPPPAISPPIPPIVLAQPMKMPEMPARRPVANIQPKMVGPAPPAIQQLTFGEGEGDQPQPDYPLEAQTGHQTGVVIVRFNVGANGRVEQATVFTACPWPLLNQAAIRSIRDTWKFSAGQTRFYEISIKYELN